MRGKIRSSHRTPWGALFLLTVLLVAPAVWATGEDVREQGAATKSEDEAEKGQTGEQGAEAKEDAPAGKPDAPAGQTPEGKAGKCGDPSVNTVEDIQAFRGSLEVLWAAPPGPVPEVTWRDAPTPASRTR